MFQISAKISFKIKYEGFWNRPCAKHNEEQRELQQAADMEILTETCTHDIKKFIALFLSFQGFFWTFRQLSQFRSFRYGMEMKKHKLFTIIVTFF